MNRSGIDVKRSEVINVIVKVGSSVKWDRRRTMLLYQGRQIEEVRSETNHHCVKPQGETDVNPREPSPIIFQGGFINECAQQEEEEDIHSFLLFTKKTTDVYNFPSLFRQGDVVTPTPIPPSSPSPPWSHSSHIYVINKSCAVCHVYNIKKRVRGA